MLKVLFVDKDYLRLYNGDIEIKILESAGIEVIVSDHLEAIELATSHTFQLIIMESIASISESFSREETKQGFETGIVIAKKILQNGCITPVLIYTSHPNLIKCKRQNLPANIIDILPKPSMPTGNGKAIRDLMSAVSTLLAVPISCPENLYF